MDSRLVGVWENRQGFTKSTRIKFAADGSMIVAIHHLENRNGYAAALLSYSRVGPVARM